MEREEWEVVVDSSEDDNKSLEEIENGLISLDYFSLENPNPDPIDEDRSVQSGSPGWIEPRSDSPYYGPKKHLSELWSDSSSEDDLGLFDSSGEINDESIVKFGNGASSGEEEERGMVWWKEIFKYCVFRVNHPVWSFSMAAAALVGFVMLGRRLYNIKNKNKNKNRTLQLKLLLDDKKVANHAARFNEAISIVKRMPILRPALPSPVVGMNQWSMMSLR